MQPVHGAALCRSHAFSVGAATRGEWRQLGAKLRPGVGAPTNPARAWRRFVLVARVFCRSRDPRRMAPARCQKLRPEVGAPTNPARAWRCVVQVARVFCGSRDPRRMAPARCQKLRPEVGAPTNRARAWRCIVQVARFCCGRRDPRRMAPARCPKSFAPRAGLPQIQPVHAAALCRSHAFSVGGGTRGEWRQLGAKKLRPEVGALQTALRAAPTRAIRLQASPHPGWLRRGATTRRMHAFGHSSGR